MSNISSICISCGSFKKAPWRKCAECGLEPKGIDLIKSVYCSVGRFSDEAERREYQAVLEEMSSILKSGQEITFEADELDRLAKEQRMVENVTWPKLLMYLLKFFLPFILIIGPFLVLLVYLKSCR